MSTRNAAVYDSPSKRVNASRIPRAGLMAVVAAVAANLLTLFVVRAVFDLPAGFQPLTPGPIILFSTIFTFLGVVAFWIVNRVARNPIRTYIWVAGIAFLLSIIPNLASMANPASAPIPGGTSLAFGVLIIFHVVGAFMFTALLLKLVQD